MEVQPSALDRLLALEARLEQIERKGLAFEDSPSLESLGRTQPIWAGDEGLLTRLLRRSPIALSAYQSNAELSTRPINSLILQQSDQSSPFQFCELSNGDAVLWISEKAPAWAYESSHCRQAFKFLNPNGEGQVLTLHRLALFKPIIRGEKWTLVQQGELSATESPYPEEADHINLSIRIENLERQLLRLSSQQEVTLRELRLQVQTNQEEINRLLSLNRKPG